ncbi:MAG: TPM domain-containing protein [Candidatus Gracilibacteria bacterium]|nr:TPM domain-containing protein [Candidatus Gracilibacteria bacterium]
MNYNPMNLPKLDLYINDFSSILKPEFKTKYNNLFAEHQKKSGEQIATVFIENRNGFELRDIALKLFNENGIGEKETNNGLLLIVSTQEKKIRIMTGKGMEIEFSDDYCRDIIENELRPLLNNGEYEKLVQAWYEISTNTRKPQKIKSNNFGNIQNNTPKYNPNNSNNINQKSNNIIGKIIVIIIFFIIFILIINIKGCNYSSNNYGDSGWGSSSSSSWGGGSSSDWGTSSSSDWGGGSSNAGGYGD